MLAEKKYKIRLDTFDLIKGILIIMIVLGHKVPHYSVDTSNVLKVLVNIAGVARFGGNPAFFVISGFGFRAMAPKKCLSKSTSELLKPFLYVMAAYAVLFPLCHYAAFRWWPSALSESTRFFLAFLLGLPESGKVFLGYELYECSVVWFVLALYVSRNILNGILNIKEEKWQRILVLACFVLGYVLAKLDFVYYCIPQGLIGVGYCYTGYLIKKTKLYNSPRLPLICAVLAAATVVQLLWGGYSMAYSMFAMGIFDCVLAGCTGVLILFIGIMIGNAEGKLLNPVKTVGVYAYWIICVHSVEMSCIPWYLWRSYMQEHQLLGMILELIIAALILAAGCVLIKQTIKNRYRRSRVKNG